MKILIDMDNVTANLMKKWVSVYNQRFDGTLTAEEVTDWQMHLFAPKCSPTEFYNIIGEPGFFANLEIMPNAVEVASRLVTAGHELFFVTATPYNNPTGGFDKCNWVQQHFPFIGRDGVIQAHKKQMIVGDVLFDDSPKNLQDFPNITVAMDWNFNKAATPDYRVSDWLEFENIINNISGELPEKI